VIVVTPVFVFFGEANWADCGTPGRRHLGPAVNAMPVPCKTQDGTYPGAIMNYVGAHGTRRSATCAPGQGPGYIRNQNVTDGVKSGRRYYFTRIDPRDFQAALDASEGTGATRPSRL